MNTAISVEIQNGAKNKEMMDIKDIFLLASQLRTRRSIKRIYTRDKPSQESSCIIMQLQFTRRLQVEVKDVYKNYSKVGSLSSSYYGYGLARKQYREGLGSYPFNKFCSCSPPKPQFFRKGQLPIPKEVCIFLGWRWNSFTDITSKSDLETITKIVTITKKCNKTVVFESITISRE
jgi:hypothetical protein